MVGRYRERFVKFRAEVIGRTEALRSVHEGAEQAYLQAIDNGQIDPDEVVRVWNTARDERVRDSHSTMHLQERRPGEPFTTGNGVSLNYPADPGGPPGETIQCRCVLSTRFKKQEPVAA
jgi:uncharacterized protein with gpF-like domain